MLKHLIGLISGMTCIFFATCHANPAVLKTPAQDHKLIQNCEIDLAKLNQIIPDSYPEVYNINPLLPFDPHGWFRHASNFKQSFATTRIKIAIEVGSWLGKSARFIANHLPEGSILLAIDTWRGSEEHQAEARCFHMPIDQLFAQFLSNVVHANLQNKIIPIRMPSIEAAARLADLNFKADFIYIDAAHDYESVTQDLCAWYPYLNKGGVFCGDDWKWPGVSRAVKDFAKDNHLNITVTNTTGWVLSEL